MKESSAEKMGKMPVNKLMLKMSLPMVISMMLQAAYNVVDSAFVSNMKHSGELALNALTLCFPVQMLMVAIGIGTGVGVNVLCAKHLGEGEEKRAAEAAGNGIFLGVVITAVFMFFGLFGTKYYLMSQTKNKIILSMANDYLKICCLGSFGIIMFSVFEKLLQSSGRSGLSTAAQISGAATNIILDPIFIYGLFGMPELGVSGAAYATVAGQIISFLCAFLFHMTKNKVIKFSFKFLKPSAQTISRIYSIGLPAIIAQALMSVMTYGINIIYGMLGENVVTAYGLYYKVQQFILFAAFGIRDAITPIVSFNYGLGDEKRVGEGIKYGILYTSAVMILGTVFLEVFAESMSGVFGLSGETENLCIAAMRIISLSFLFAGFNVAAQGIFQALESGIYSLVISLLRQCVLVLPAANVLSVFAVSDIKYVNAVWFAFIFAEVLSALISFKFLFNINKNKILN